MGITVIKKDGGGGGGGSTAWGDITGTLADQTDLQSALDAISGGFWDLSAIQNNEQTVTNSTTFVDSDDLQITLEAGKTYILSYFLGLDDNDNAGGAFGSAKHCLTYTGTSSYSRQSKFNYGSGRQYYSQQEFGGSNDSFVVPKGTVWQGAGMIQTTTAGTLKVQFAQGTATASTTAYLRAWSFLLAKEVV